MVTGSGIYQELNDGTLAERGGYNGQTTLIELVKLTDSQIEINQVSNNPVPIAFDDTPSIDAFSRARVSNGYTIFDSKQLFDNQPLLWDDARISGTGTSSVFLPNESATEIFVSGSVSGMRARQTFRRFSYQPGKSQLILMTFADFDTSTGITKRIGYFDQKNGLFFQSSEGTVSVVRRTYVTGAAIDNAVAQSSWNLDKMDGTGKSGITLDFSKTQIAVIDFQWLGVGRVRMGFDIDGLVVYCHEFLNANSLSTVYMSTPVLPLRYEISSDGTGASDSLKTICSAVISEGGQDRTGIVRHHHKLSISGLATGNQYALLGLRLNPSKLGAAELVSVSITSSTANDLGHWMVVRDPMVSGTFSYSDETNSIVQIAEGTSANTMSGGTQIDGGFFQTTSPRTETLKTASQFGSKIDGTPVPIIVSLIPITNNITVGVSVEWREL